MARSHRRRNAIVGATILALTSLIAAVPATASGQDSPASDRQAAAAEQVIEGHYIVVYEDSAGPVNPATARLEAKLGFKSELRYRHAVSGFAAELHPGQLRALERDPDVAFVSADRVVTATGSVPLASGEPVPPTGVRRVLSATTKTVREASAVDVAVIDTGVQLDHPDLNVSDGTDCVDPGTPASDGDGHGTHVAGTIAAANDGSGVVGIAPDTEIHPVRVLDDTGSGTWSQVICGIDWVTANAASLGIGVANMSLGGLGQQVRTCATTRDTMHLAICDSTAAGVNYVVAAGNDGRDFDFATEPDLPAAYPEVLTVTAISDSDGVGGGVGDGPSCWPGQGDDRPATFSNFAGTDTGAEHTIAAPGVCIRSTSPSGSYAELSGTSMAAPHVAGLVALCLDEAGTSGPCAGMSPADVIAWMRADAESFTTANDDFGFLNDPLHDPIGSPEPQRYGFLAVMPGSGPPPSAPTPTSTPPATSESDEPDSSTSNDSDPIAPAPVPEEPPPADEVVDEVPLESTITVVRKDRLRAGSSRARVKLRFTSSQPAPRFRCSLNRQRFQRCGSPFKARVKAGKHKLRLKTKADGERVLTVKRFKVRRARR